MEGEAHCLMAQLVTEGVQLPNTGMQTRQTKLRECELLCT